jgi:hypothetical protein
MSTAMVSMNAQEVALPPATISAQALEKVIIGGDLSALSPNQRLEYYQAVCRSLGLNPLTKPFEYLRLNDRLRLYPLRDCTDQLRRLHGISIYITNRAKVEDVYIVTARARDERGREDESTGAVHVGKISGEALANAMMKSETKAKRRVTLSIAGLGWLDESEVDAIPNAHPVYLADDDNQRAVLKAAILDTLRQLPPGTTSQAQRNELVREAFSTSWKGLDTFSIAEIQAGYIRLQALVSPPHGDDITDDVPDHLPPGDTTLPTPESSPTGEGEVITTGQPAGMATPRDVEELRTLARAVDAAAEQHVEESLAHWPAGRMPLGIVQEIRGNLQKRTAAGKP